MTHTPPAVAADWPAADRLAYIAWLATLTLHRIDLDDPAVPLLSKRPVRSLFAWLAAVAAHHPEALEVCRADLMKPFDPAGNYHAVEVPAEWLAVLAEMQEKKGGGA